MRGDDTLDSLPEGGAPAPAAPTQRYQIVGELGQGGLGRVYLANDRVLDRPVALKELRRTSPAAVARFGREMRITARLEHPSIVPVHDAGQDPTVAPFYTMKAVEGRSLQEILEGAGSMSERLALLPALTDVCEALSYAHARGIVHRDLKPQNIMLGAFGETLVIDWGLAKRVDEADDGLDLRFDDVDEQLTQLGAVVGTPAYMSPEQASGASVDARTDVFALGALLYAVLSGRPPYAGATGEETLEKARRAAFRPLAELEPRLPRDLHAIAAKAMALDPTERYPSAAELTADLKRFQTGQLVAAYDYSLLEQLARLVSRHRVPVGISALAAVALGSVSVVAFREVVAARDREQDRADEVVFEQASMALDTNPVRSLHLLGELSERWTRWPDAAIVAADAVSRGIPTRLQPHQGAAVALAASPDGARVASGGVDRRVRVHDVATGAVIATGEGSTEAVGTVAFSPDGARVAAASDAVGRVWDASTGALLLSLEPADDVLSTMVWSADGRWLATPSYDGVTPVWTAAGERVHRLEGHEDAVMDATFTPDGGSLLTVGYEGRAILWDVSSGDVLREWTTPDRLQAVAASPDGQRFALYGESSKVWVVGPDLEEAITLDGHADWIQLLAWDATGERLATASLDRTVRVWGRDGGRLAVLNGHDGSVESVDFMADGSLVSAGSDGRVVRWTTDYGQSHVLRGHEHAAYAVAAGDRIVSCDIGGALLAWHLERADLRDVHRHPGAVASLAFMDDDLVVSADEAGDVRLASMGSGGTRQATVEVGQVLSVRAAGGYALVAGEGGMAVLDRGGEVVVTLLGEAQPGCVGALGPRGEQAFYGQIDGTMTLVDLPDGEARSVAAHDDAITCLAVSPRGGQVASVGYDHAVRLVDTSVDPPTVRELGRHETPVLYVAFSQDGATVYSSGAAGDVRAWPVGEGTPSHLSGATYMNVVLQGGPRGQLAGGDAIGALQVWQAPDREPTTMLGHTAPIDDVAWHPSGGRLATTSEDGTVRLWLASGGASRTLALQAGPVAQAAWSPDGRWLVTGAEDGSVVAWDQSFPEDPDALRAQVAEELRARGWTR